MESSMICCSSSFICIRWNSLLILICGDDNYNHNDSGGCIYDYVDNNTGFNDIDDTYSRLPFRTNVALHFCAAEGCYHAMCTVFWEVD